MTDILARIDAAVGCQQCGGALGRSPSGDFCGDACQRAWHAARADTLTGYAEPYDLSWSDPDQMMRWAPDAEFRLPRSTGNLRADWLAARRAEAAATVESQRAAVRLRVQSLNERERAAALVVMETMRPAMEAAARRFRVLSETAAAALRGVVRGS